MVYRPKNKEELFNLRHASARNVIERIFGAIKQRYRILLLPPKFNLEIQAHIPAALSAIHNFICMHNPNEEPAPEEDNVQNDISSVSGAGSVDTAVMETNEVVTSGTRRDQIAQAMWDDYQRWCCETGIDEDDVLSDSDTMPI